MSKYRNQSEAGEAIPASRFAVNVMFCPGCRAALREPAEKCPSCGYSGGSAVKKFPFEAPEFERFIDPGHHLGNESRREIDAILDSLAERFPQVRFCFCIVELADKTDPREFGFWLMNASPVRGPVEERLRPWSVLLLIDHAHRRVSVTSGYAIEPFLNEESWKSLLQLEARSFLEGDYGSAILRFLNGASAVLSEAAVRVSEASGRKARGAQRW